MEITCKRVSRCTYFNESLVAICAVRITTVITTISDYRCQFGKIPEIFVCQMNYRAIFGFGFLNGIYIKSAAFLCLPKTMRYIGMQNRINPRMSMTANLFSERWDFVSLSDSSALFFRFTELDRERACFCKNESSNYVDNDGEYQLHFRHSGCVRYII